MRSAILFLLTSTLAVSFVCRSEELTLSVVGIQIAGRDVESVVDLDVVPPGKDRTEKRTLKLRDSITQGTEVRVPGRTLIVLRSPAPCQERGGASSCNEITLFANTVFVANTLSPQGETYSVCEGRVTFSITNALSFFNVACKRFLAAIRGTQFSVEADADSRIRFAVTEGKLWVSREVKVGIEKENTELGGFIAGETLVPGGKWQAVYPLNRDEYLGRFRTYGDAEQYFRQQLEGDAMAKTGYLDVQRDLLGLGVILQRVGRPQEAIGYYTRALEAARSERDLKREAWALNNLGAASLEVDDVSSALKYDQEALALRRKLYRRLHKEIAESHNNLALANRRAGDYCHSIGHHLEALSIRRRLHGGEVDADVAQSYSNLGSVYRDLGRPAEAIDSYEKALLLRKQLYRSDAHPGIAITKHNIAGAYLDLKETQKAIDNEMAAVRLFKQWFQPPHPYLAASYDGLGSAYRQLGDLRSALESHRFAYEMNRQRFPSGDHLELAASLSNLGRVYADIGESGKALAAHKEALAMLQRLYPGGGAYVAGSLSDLGALYTQQGELAQAYSYYERALALRLKAYPGGIHPSVAEIYRSLSALAQKLGQGARAQEYAQQATRIDAEMKEPLRCPELESG